jgi:hypothetical protein
VSDVITRAVDDPAGDEAPRRRVWVRWVLLSVCLGIAAMWVYALFFASKEGVYYVTDGAWRTAANQLCADATQQRLALEDTGDGFISDPTHEQMLQRADIVDHATDIIATMVDRIDALPVAGDKNRQRVDVFLGYYRTILDNRRTYTARLREFRLEPYRETEVAGGPVSNVIIDFTTGNAIPECMPPSELSGA